MTIVKGPLFMIVGSIFVYMITMGMITTTSFSLAINKQGHRAGSASALLGMMPLFIGACVAPLVGLDESTAIPMGAIIFTSTIIALFSFFQIALRGERLEEELAKHSVTS
jgi:DHA1 family bicyclomycin/chloramphenicol resistance-like MFS transporter